MSLWTAFAVALGAAAVSVFGAFCASRDCRRKAIENVCFLTFVLASAIALMVAGAILNASYPS